MGVTLGYIIYYIMYNMLYIYCVTNGYTLFVVVRISGDFFFNKMYGEGMVRVSVWEEGRMFCFLMNDDYLYK